jgi:homeobox protein cut-like
MSRIAGSDEGLLIQSLQLSKDAWQDFDYHNKMGTFLQTANQIKEQKESSLQARKLLADTTKQFKRSVKSMEMSCTALKEANTPETSSGAIKSMESLGKECRGLVKDYQEEIDNLTRRSKASEGAFGTLFAGLQEVADPAALLASALDQIINYQSQMNQLLATVDKVNREMANMDENYSSERESMQKQIEKLKKAKDSEPNSGMSRDDREELVQLRREVAEYEVEFRSLKNQDITIRKLEAKIQDMQENSKEELAKELSKAQQDLAETEGRRAAEALEREAAMERRVHSLELQLKAERAGREATQSHLLDQEDGAGEREAAWDAQRRILVDDAERLRETLHEATRERDELRLRVGALQGSGFKTGKTPPPSGGLAMADMILERRAYEAEVSLTVF